MKLEAEGSELVAAHGHAGFAGPGSGFRLGGRRARGCGSFDHSLSHQVDAQLGEPPESKPRRTIERSVQPSSLRDAPGPQCVLPFPTLRDQGLNVGDTLPERCRLRDEQAILLQLDMANRHRCEAGT